MPSLKEIEYYLRGIVLLIQGKPQGFGYLDLTDRGMIRSFWAMVWCFPPTAISWVWWQTAFLRAHPPALILLLIFSLIRLLRMICGQQPLIIATLVLLLLVPSMFLSDYLQQYLGVYPA